MKIPKHHPSDVQKFRRKWWNKGFELVNITTLCRLQLGTSGWCNDINEPDESCHHVQIWYRDEVIANVSDGIELMDEDKYCVFFTERWKMDNISDFIIFRKVKR